MNIDKDVLKEAISHWGIDAQLGMIQEECAELIVAINKWFRNSDGCKEMVIEELGDCLVMCYQGLEIFGEDEVQKSIDKKIEIIKLRLKK